MHQQTQAQYGAATASLAHRVRYEQADARQLPYAPASFELILEKGTLDALLSDPTSGPESCRDMLAECARVVTVPGYIVLVSHVNAAAVEVAEGEGGDDNDDDGSASAGMTWLQEIIIPGLQAGVAPTTGPTEEEEAPPIRWRIEVHHSGGTAGGGKTSSGPAVYVIEKIGSVAASSSSKHDDDTDTRRHEPPTIDIQFVAY